MKSKIFIIITLIISLFITQNVNAADTEHDLIYDIENFTIEDDNIIFEGWGFVLNYWNKGGSDSIISITANGQTIKNEKVEYFSNYDRDRYEANCIKYDKKKTCTDTYDKATCTIGQALSNCRYDNMSFRVTIPIKSLIDQFTGNQTIVFKLNINHKGVSYSRNIAVSSDSTNLTNGQVLNEEDGTTLSISGISEYATIRVDDGRVVEETGPFIYSSNYKWVKGKSYKIIQTSKGGKYSSIRMYNLMFNENTWGYCDDKGTYKYFCSISTPARIAGRALPGTTKTNGWAYATWLQVDGSVKITLGNPTEETCPAEYNNENGPTCENPDGEFEQVVIEKIKIEDEFPDDYSKYNLINDTGSDCAGEGWIDRILTATACITQYGEATFNLENSEIYSGGGFNFYANYVSKTTYQFCKRNGDKYNVTMQIIDHYCMNDTCGGGCKPCKEKCGCGNYPTKSCDSVEPYYGTPKEITSSDEEWDIVTAYMQDLLDEPDDNATTWSLDSNVVTDDNAYVEIGDWTSSYEDDSDGDSNHWEPGEEITYELEFSLDTACINRQTAEVTYRNGSCKSYEVDGGELYYIPLKQPTGLFPISVTIDDVNVLKDETWRIDYDCNVNCRQKLYNNDGSYKFIYRPISLSNPFASRTPGDNWIPFWDDYTSGVTKAKEVMTRNTLEYSIVLGPSDISSIKRYNRNSQYTNLNTISDAGRSGFLSEYGILNKVRSNYFNDLGECNSNCWPTDSLYEGSW